MNPDVLIIGAGPAGLAAAAALRSEGIDDVVVVEREPEAGGIPRFCPHPTFGLTDFFRPMSGPAYAARLRAKLDPGSILTSTTATAIGDDLDVVLCSDRGERLVRPKRLLIATGIRETPRAGRLISGDRPHNILTTGALQRILAATDRLPFRRPLVVGTELVSFSAVLSLREAGAKPVAMLEPGSRIVARRPADLVTRLFLQTPILLETRVTRINAAASDASRLASVTVERGGRSEEIACDAVIFTGSFVPEASLLGHRPDLCDPGSLGAAIDQFWRSKAPGLYAAGNVLRPVETAAYAAREGRLAGRSIAADLLGRRDLPKRLVPILTAEPIAFSTPSAVAVPVGDGNRVRLDLRMAAPASGRLVLTADNREFWRSARMNLLPERRIAIAAEFPPLDHVGAIRLELTGNG